MIAARRGRTDITNILLEGKHINLDIQENVRQHKNTIILSMNRQELLSYSTNWPNLFVFTNGTLKVSLGPQGAPEDCCHRVSTAVYTIAAVG